MTARIARFGPSVAAALLIALACFYIGRKSSVYFDDVYITLTYAKNLATGAGMVFRPGERVQGTTTPLWCFMNAALMSAGVSGPAGAKALFLLTTWAAGFALFRYSRSLGYATEGILAGILYPLLPMHVWVFGAETSLCVWLALETLIWREERPWLAGICCGLLMLTRLDGGAIWIIVAGSYLLSRKRNDAICFSLVAGAIILPWLAFAWWYYGSPLPNTLGAKRVQLELARATGNMPWIKTTLQGAWMYLSDWARGPLALTAAFALAGFLRILMASRKTWRLPAWTAIHIGVYSALGVAFYDWYLYPLWVLAVWTVAMGWGWAVASVERIVKAAGRRHREHERLVTGAIAFILALLILNISRRPWWGDPAAGQRARYDGYLEVAAYMRGAGASADESALCWEVGVMGFESPTRIVDLAGLVDRSAEHGQAFNKDSLIASRRPEYILESWPANGRVENLRAEARAGKFTMQYGDGAGGILNYAEVFLIDNYWGMRVLLRRQS